MKVDDPNSWGIPDINLTSSTLNRFGNDANGPFTIDNKYFQVVDNFSWITGKHSFRFGGDWRINQFLQIGNEFARGRFTVYGKFHWKCEHAVRAGTREQISARVASAHRKRGRARQE